MDADPRLLFGQMEVGQEWDSPERVVSQDDIIDFAELTGDRNPIHLDAEYARTTPFRRCIAHGLLGLGLAAGLACLAPAVRTVAILGLREWHFRKPIYVGDRIRVRTRVLDKELRGSGRRGQVVWQIQVFNQNDEVVQEGVTATLVEAAAGEAAEEKTAEQAAA